VCTDAQVAPTASTNGNPDDEEKMTGKSGGGEAGREDEVGDAGEISLEQVTDQWEIQFEPGERINPKVRDSQLNDVG